MLFLKKFLLGLGALVLILAGGSGTQSNNIILQGGGFIGLIIGLIALYILPKWPGARWGVCRHLLW